MPKKTKSEQAKQLGSWVADMINKQRDLYEHAEESQEPWWADMDPDEAYCQRMEAEAIEREAIEQQEDDQIENYRGE